MRVSLRTAIALALGAVAFTPRAWGQTIVVGPKASSMSTIPHASLTVPVVADLTSSGGASLGSIRARLTWRPGTLQFSGTGLGTLGAPVVNADSAASGILKFAVANASGATGAPVVINASFNVTGAAGDTTTLGVTVNEITRAATFVDLMPITSTTPGKFCVSAGRWGDVDGNDSLTSHDALIIVTNAVGLPIAPYTVVNGDVDGSGTVDTRDALIVLSYAVGLPVSQFRVATLNTGSCTLRAAASVQIQPRAPAVLPGERVPLTATVKDSTGAIVQGIGLVWASKDTTIARADAAGNVIGVAAGSTFALATVSPGVKDSVPVTVSGVRHVWYVNPVVAAGNPVELGSQLYPFSAIGAGIAAAAANDTVRVAVADYGATVRITKALVVLGDSTAAGFPRISNPIGPALVIDSVPAGAVVLQGLRLLNSQGGVLAQAVQRLSLTAVSVEGSRGVGIGVRQVGQLLSLTRTQVVGAMRRGIELDTVPEVRLDHVRSDLVASLSGDTLPPLALRVVGSDTVSGDSLTLGTAGLRVDSANALVLHRARVAGSKGPALFAMAGTISVVASDFSGAAPASGSPVFSDPMSFAVSLHLPSGGAVRLDSSRVRDNHLFAIYVAGGATDSLRSDSVARNSPQPGVGAGSFTGFAALKIANSVFASNGPGPVMIQGLSGNTVTVDTTTFDATNLVVSGGAALVMHGGAVRHGEASQLDVESVTGVVLTGIEASGNTTSSWYYDLAQPAVFVYNADSVIVTGMSGHDNQGGALGVFFAQKLSVAGSTMLHNGTGLFPYYVTRATLAAYNVTSTRVYGLTLRDSADVAIYVQAPGSSGAVVDSSALEGSYALIRETHCCSVYQDTLVVSRSSLTGFGGTSAVGVDADYLSQLSVTRNLMDSLFLTGVQTYSVDTSVVFGNRFRAWGNAGVNVSYGASVVADSNAFVGCSAGATATAVVSVWQGATTVSGDTLNGCGSLVWVSGTYALSGGPPVAVLGNVVTRDTTSTVPTVNLQGGLGRVRVVGNSIVGGAGRGIHVDAQSYGIDSARVDSNVVRLVHGNGIELGVGFSAPPSLTYNLISGNTGPGLFSGTAFNAQFNTVAYNLNIGVADTSGGTSSFRLGNIVGNMPWGAATKSTLVADSNWWGRKQGPKCRAGCDTTTTAAGDSAIGGTVTVAPYDTLLVAAAPAIPAPPGSPLARPAVVASVAVPKAPTGVERPRPVRRPQPARPAVLPLRAKDLR
jgi:hypothetical protein